MVGTGYRDAGADGATRHAGLSVCGTGAVLWRLAAASRAARAEGIWADGQIEARDGRQCAGWSWAETRAGDLTAIKLMLAQQATAS